LNVWKVAELNTNREINFYLRYEYEESLHQNGIRESQQQARNEEKSFLSQTFYQHL
jgi:hypothetical protein